MRESNKCILCGRCVSVCHSVQGVGAIDFAGRGFETRVTPAFYEGLNVSGCIFCGQCIRACPTARLTEKSHVEDVIRALADPKVMVVAQVAPAVPATLMEELDVPSVTDMLEALSGALRQVGFEAVFDTSFTADLTIIEEVSELIHGSRTGSPAHVHELLSRLGPIHRGPSAEMIPYLSTCKSPQQMMAP